MKEVYTLTTKEYEYESKESRDINVEYMESLGWQCDGQIRKLKEGVSLLDYTEEDRIFMARFQKYE